MLVFFCMAPVEKVWTAGKDAKELGPLDMIAMSVTFAAIAIEYISDAQLRNFR